jgi:hypothetical protein
VTALTGASFTSSGNALSYTPGQTGVGFAAGIYDVVMSVDWGTPNAAGYRQISLTDGASFTASNQVASAGNSSDTIQQLSWIGQLGASTTLYPQASQNSGITLVVVPDNSCYLSAVKIG